VKHCTIQPRIENVVFNADREVSVTDTRAVPVTIGQRPLHPRHGNDIMRSLEDVRALIGLLNRV
jgi:hypothetical protein